MAGPISPFGADSGGFAHGALVGAIGPGGNLEVSGRDVTGGTLDVFADAIPPPSLLAAAHGAAVPPVGGAAAAVLPAAQGALDPDSADGAGRADGGPGGAWL